MNHQKGCALLEDFRGSCDCAVTYPCLIEDEKALERAKRNSSFLAEGKKIRDRGRKEGIDDCQVNE